MGALALSETELKSLWNSIKVTDVSPDKVKQISEHYKTTEKMTSSFLSVLKKIASGSSFDEFKHFLQTANMPAVKLTSSEMEALKGGAFTRIWPPIILGPGPFNPFPPISF